MQIIPIQSVPAQTFSVQLAGQNCVINIYQKNYGLFVDLYINGTLIIGGVIAENINRIVRSVYLGFTGDLIFIDTQGTSDPYYVGLGSQYLLAYLEESDLEELGLAT